MKGPFTDLSRVRARAILVALALAALLGMAVQGQAANSDPKVDLVTVASDKQHKDPTLVLTKGMAEVVPLEGAVADIMVANPSIVDVSALQANKLYIVGVNYGTTNVIAVDAAGNVIGRMNVHVKIDDVAIQNTISKLFPDEDIRISSTASQVILAGHVSTPDVAQRAANVVAQYVGEVQSRQGTADQLIVNMMTVAGEQQVMLRVKIVEASRDVLRELGIETNFQGGTGDSRAIGSFLTTAATGLTADPLGAGSVIYDAGIDETGPIQLIIRALEEDGLINTLAEPNLTAISGEQAGFLAGGEFPIPASRDQNGNIVVDYKPFGVALNFRPIVLSDKRISLQLQTEVSSISNQNTLNVNQLNIPGFAVRRAETTVELSSGGSLMIAGLLQSEVRKSLNQLPGVKDIPILGDLVSSESFNRNESELVVIVTAFLVKPYDDAKSNAKEVSERAGNPLARAFVENIRRTYAKLALDPDLLNCDGQCGYLIK